MTENHSAFIKRTEKTKDFEFYTGHLVKEDEAVEQDASIVRVLRPNGKGEGEKREYQG